MRDDDVQCPVWLPHFSTDVPAGELTLRSGAAHQLIALSRETQLLIALSVNDDSVLEVTVLSHAVPAPTTALGSGNHRLTAQQHLDYWLEKFREAYNGTDANTQVRRQARREVAYWRREVRVEHRRLRRGD